MQTIEETIGSKLPSKTHDQIVPLALARAVLQENHIEMSVDDPRSAVQYVTELLVYIEACQEKEK